MADDDFPDDPFKQHVPKFEDFTGPYADDIKELIHTYAGSQQDVIALVQQQSFRELGIAIEALDEDRVRGALLNAVTLMIGGAWKDDPTRFTEWIEKQ